MNKMPSFPFYPKDFLSSLDVQMMSAEKVGAYILLLSNSWIQEDQCYLPDDDELLRKICRIKKEKWGKIKDKILKKFNKKDGKIYSKKLLLLKNEYQDFRFQKSESGKIGAKIRWGSQKNSTPKDSPMAKNGTPKKVPMAKNSFALAPSPSPSNKYKDFFEEFWKKYPDKTNQSKKKTFEKYISIFKKYPKIHEKIILSLNKQIKVFTMNKACNIWQPNWKHAITWLNQECWDNKVEIKKDEMLPADIKAKIEKYKSNLNKQPSQELIKKWKDDFFSKNKEFKSLDEFIK
jgi:uncharacterized protein YdaU (DUF1376 family)